MVEQWAPNFVNGLKTSKAEPGLDYSLLCYRTARHSVIRVSFSTRKNKTDAAQDDILI